MERDSNDSLMVPESGAQQSGRGSDELRGVDQLHSDGKKFRLAVGLEPPHKNEANVPCFEMPRTTDDAAHERLTGSPRGGRFEMLPDSLITDGTEPRYIQPRLEVDHNSPQGVVTKGAPSRIYSQDGERDLPEAEHNTMPVRRSGYAKKQK